MNPGSLDKIASYCLVTGTDPFFGLFRLPQELDEVKDSLIDEVKESGDGFDLEEYAHLPSQPELWFIIETLKKSIEEKYVKSFLEFDQYFLSKLESSEQKNKESSLINSRVAWPRAA